MLFDIAAVTSIALGPVSEAFGLHEITVYTAAHSHAGPSNTFDVGGPIPVAPPVPFIGPDSTPTIEGLILSDGFAEAGGSIGGTRLLHQLSDLDPRGVERWVAAHPEAMTDLLISPPPAGAVTAWWESTSADNRTALDNAAPGVLGNLEGVPYAVRDSANRTMLTRTIAELEQISSQQPGRAVAESVHQQLRMLQSISDALTGPIQAPFARSDVAASRTLLTLDVEGQGRAAIVIGDLETADYVSFLVPGMFFTVENQMNYWVGASDELYTEQSRWLNRLDRSEGMTGVPIGKTVATIAWMGYHTPNLTNVGSIDNAIAGGRWLSGALSGLGAMRSDDEPYVSVISHSYGSTAALLALAGEPVEVDALAVVGSPGSPAASASDLHVRHENVFVGEAAWDPIPNSSYFGSDPGSERYGARTLGVGGGSDPETGTELLGSAGHNEYFLPGTESMRNFALIGIGRGDLATGAS